MKKIYWFITNLYGKIFGWPFLSGFHHIVATCSMHALGYGNMYRENWTGEERFLKKVIAKSNPKLILDVGANVGSYSKLLLKYTNAKIYAFEPNPASFAELSKLPERVIKINSAVGEEEGEAVLNYKGDFDGKASLDVNIRKGKSVEVEVTTIESFLNKNGIAEVDFLKIDTEGFELEVLKGLGKIKPRFIQFEFNDHHIIKSNNMRDFSKLLDGYTLYRLLPNGWLKVNPKSYLDNVFLFSNCVAVLNEIDGR